MKKETFFKKLKTNYIRYLAVFCAFSVFLLGSVSLCFPIGNKGISAQADMVYPSTTGLQIVSDMYAYDYMEIIIPISNEPKSFIFGSPNYFYNPNGEVNFRDGLSFGAPNSSDIVLNRSYTIQSQYTLPQDGSYFHLDNVGGFFNIQGSNNARLTATTSAMSFYGSNVALISFYYDEIVVPASWVGTSYVPYIRPFLPANSSVGVSAQNKRPLYVEVYGEIHSEFGIQRTWRGEQVELDSASGFNYRLFPSAAFEGLLGSLFWLKDYRIDIAFEGYYDNTSILSPSFQMTYMSYVADPMWSFSDSITTYLDNADFIQFTDNPFAIDLTDWLVTAVKGFFDAELWAGFSIAGVLGIIVACRIVIYLLKMFAGG